MVRTTLLYTASPYMPVTGLVPCQLSLLGHNRGISAAPMHVGHGCRERIFVHTRVHIDVAANVAVMEEESDVDYRDIPVSDCVAYSVALAGLGADVNAVPAGERDFRRSHCSPGS